MWSQSVNPLRRSQSHPAGVLSSRFKSASSFVFLNWHLCPVAALSLFISAVSLSLCCESCLLSVEGFFDKRSLCQPTHQRKPSSSSSSSPFHSLSLRAFLLLDSASLPPVCTPHSFGALRALELQRDQLLLSICLSFLSISSLVHHHSLSLPFSHYLLDLV